MKSNFLLGLLILVAVGFGSTEAFVFAADAPPHIARVWHGRTTNAKAEEYRVYLADQIKGFISIKGNLGYEMLSEKVGDETHFMVISYWNSKDAIHAYAGAEIGQTHGLKRDSEFLIAPEKTVHNYDIVVDRVK